MFEKEQYPFHKVCGEYISLESWDFLISLGLDLDKMNLPVISMLQVSAVNGKMLEHKLPLGWFWSQPLSSLIIAWLKLRVARASLYWKIQR